MSDQLSDLRGRLDALDAELVRQLTERFRLALAAADAKSGATVPLRDQQREAELLHEVRRHAREHGMDEEVIDSLYRGILEHSVRYQVEHMAKATDSRPIRVTYQGSDGAYSQIAARRHFADRGRELELRGSPTFRETLEAVSRGEADRALLPIENTTAGSINEAYDLLADTRLVAVGEEILRIDHCLVALRPVPVESITRVLSHPQALAQCSRFLGNLADCTAEAYTDTAMAVERIVAEDDSTQAAIASAEAASLHGLTVIARNIANQRENYTRFLVIAREAATLEGETPCKTSLVLVTRHERGALARCLDVLAEHDLNLTKLESRPLPKTPWEYTFYLDFEGNANDDNVAEALRRVTARARYIRVLGSYPCAQATAGWRSTSTPRRRASTRLQRLEPAKTEDQAHASSSYPLASRATRNEDTLVRIGQVTVGGHEPVLIGGPCSVESATQIAACAAAVKESGGQMLRGGCFKPRTSPYSFQGLGYEGLELLAEAGRRYGLPIVTEVLHPGDVAGVAELADVLQIGARNVQNFALLRAVGEVQRPVLLKRGMMSCIEEWLAAAEYILERGNQEVILCERGIRTFETATRGTLDLSAIPVVRERTHLPVIVDPSHAAGLRRWVPPLARAALAVGAHGVMVEIHPEPDKAKSDGPQSLTLPQFARLARELRGEGDLELAV